MAICLPGNASRVKRAVTSEIRSPPLVMTMKLMITRITNTTRPTMKLPPITTSPNDSITLPAAPVPVWPSSSTTRVEATFRHRRSKVVMRITVGNREKSSGLFDDTLTSSTRMAMAMLKVNRASSSTGGSGRMTMARIDRISTGIPMRPLRKVGASCCSRFMNQPLLAKLSGIGRLLASSGLLLRPWRQALSCRM